MDRKDTLKVAKFFLLGIGHPLRSDDGAGSFIAQHFKDIDWIVVDGKSAPENFVSVIKRSSPELLVIVDSVEMNLTAGSIRIIPLKKIVSFQLSTHYLSLSYFIEYVSPYCQKIILIGIQPFSIKMGEKLSKPVLEACYLVMELLKNRRFNDITVLT